MIASSPSALSLPLRTPRVLPRTPVLRPTEIAPRFTVDGDAALEQHLAESCRRIAAGVRGLIPRRKLEALLLGGGYGRGEGGVLRTASGCQPYNDLEFYVCLRGSRLLNERRFGHALHVLGEILTPQVGVEVEFKITSLTEIRRSPVSMFYYDLIVGHRWLVGEEALLAGCSHHRRADQIPLTEATRLMMNRCSGLLFAREKLERARFTAADADFVGRNIAKAQLALGDAVLVAFGLYDSQVRERHHRLVKLAANESLPWLDAVRQHHAAGVDFKLHPRRSAASRDDLLACHAPVAALAREVWLWLEQRRIRAPFATARDYATSTLNKWRDASPQRNVLVNLRLLGLAGWRDGRSMRHPRERILNALTLLLWEPATLGTPALLRAVQRELHTDATSFPALVERYQALWSRVN